MTAGPFAEVARANASAPTLNVNETGWRQARQRVWLWTVVGTGLTFFCIDRSRGVDALRRLIGEAIPLVVISDRFPTYNWVAFF